MCFANKDVFHGKFFFSFSLFIAMYFLLMDLVGCVSVCGLNDIFVKLYNELIKLDGFSHGVMLL